MTGFTTRPSCLSRSLIICALIIAACISCRLRSVSKCKYGMKAKMLPLATDIMSFLPGELGDLRCPLLVREELILGRFAWCSDCRVGVSVPLVFFVAGLEPPLNLDDFLGLSLDFPLVSFPAAVPELPAVQSVWSVLTVPVRTGVRGKCGKGAVSCAPAVASMLSPSPLLTMI
jgi:hypothetical protein